MKAFNKRTIVRQEKRVSDTIQVGGREFYLDSMFRQYWNTVQMAEVVDADRNDVDAGDIVYVHHFVSAEQQVLRTKETMSFLEYGQVYAKVKEDGDVMVLDKFVLVKPVTYGEAGLLENKGGLLMTMHSENDEVERIGVVGKLSDEAKATGLKEGDIVLFNKNCEYEMLIQGKLYYRMEIRDIITTLDSFDDISA